jgi:hypothetical protein
MQNAQDASHTPSTEDLIAAILAAENEDNQLPLGDLLDWINGDGSDTLSANESEASGSPKAANGLASRKRTYEMRKVRLLTSKTALVCQTEAVLCIVSA